MNCNDIIQRIVNAIIKQEGMPPTYNNPGNLRQAPWLPNADVSLFHGFWVPTSRSQGIAGAAHVVALHIAEGNSLSQLISIWAPPNENDTNSFIRNVKVWAGIPDENVPLYTLITYGV